MQTINEKMLELLDKPFMQIFKSPADYEILEEKSGSNRDHLIVTLQIKNIKNEYILKLKQNYQECAKDFDNWAIKNDFISSQILGGEDNTLSFEIITFT